MTASSTVPAGFPLRRFDDGDLAQENSHVAANLGRTGQDAVPPNSHTRPSGMPRTAAASLNA